MGRKVLSAYVGYTCIGLLQLLVLETLCMSYIQSVSYTHLDVYKRQLEILYISCTNCSQLYIVRRDSTAVSYTHLDVYKRQTVCNWKDETIYKNLYYSVRTGRSSRCTVDDLRKRTTVACVSYLYPCLGQHLQWYEIDMSETVSGFSSPTLCQFRYFLYFCELQSPVSILLYLSYNYFYNTCSL